LEGIVAKDRYSLYESGRRSGKWQKFKLNTEEKFWIGGFIPDGKRGVESIVLGKREGNALSYVGCLNVHMPARARPELASKLERLIMPESPFDEIPARERGNSWSGGMTEEDIGRSVWIKPQAKAEVSFLEWTNGGFLRHAKVKRILDQE
jgi:bifunctional non-homologous end joining protein LigD